MGRYLFAVWAAVCLIAGCASAPSHEDRARAAIGEEVGDKVLVSDKASALVEGKGEATAAFRGFSRESELICEHLTLRGSHRKTTFCYTRAERDRMNLNHTGTWIDLLMHGNRVNQ